jgi:tripartite-type tricarboxylate transporter receptor subunit TctC
MDFMTKGHRLKRRFLEKTLSKKQDRMIKRFFLLIALVIGLTLISGVTLAAVPFYEGKVIRIIAGTSPGSGFDIYSRVVARHMGKHIPGNPAILVENMAGAGGLISVNYIYKIPKPDGLTIGHFNGALFFNQLLGQPGAEFDARKFGYIGAAAKEECACVLTKASGITSIDKWMASKTPVKLGGVALGNFIDNSVRILKAALGLPIQLVTGYKGSADIRLAAESGELAGSAWGWDSMKATWRKALETGDVVVILQAVPKPLVDLPNVPLAVNLAKTEEARQLIEVGIHSVGTFIRPFVLPPGTPKERVQILRKAFQETLKDKEFLAESEKAKLGLGPVDGDELENAVNGIFKLDPTMLAKLKDILYK